MPVLSVRITDAEDEIIRQKAAEEGVATKSDILRLALDSYLKAGKTKSNPIKRMFGKSSECEHPWSKRMQLPSGIQCDDCGEWL
jgi:hypothetical protein